MLHLEITTSEIYEKDGPNEEDIYCLYEMDIPLDTPWSDIQTMVRLSHPDCTEITIRMVVE